MEFEHQELEVIHEKRLVGTIITGKPKKSSLAVTFSTILVIALVTQFYWQAPPIWSELLPAIKDKIYNEGEWWRVFTAIFIHADFGHFLSNMYMLGIFSFFVYGYFGFGVYPILSFFCAGIVNALSIMTYAPEVRLLGASGLVYLLGGVWFTLYFLVQRQYSLVNRSLRVIGIGFMIFLPTTFVPTVSYRTHAIGFVVGVVMGVVYFYRNQKFIRTCEVYETR